MKTSKWILLAAAALLLSPVLEQPPAAAAGGGALRVAISYPQEGDNSYGEFELAATVEAGEPIKAVEFYVDGELEGVVKHPPYKLKVDVGWENQDHHYRVVAISASGLTAEAHRTTRAVAVDDNVTIQLRQLYVTVGSGGARGLGLERGDFEIFDEGDRQETITFERGDIPITAVVLLDTSDSMTGTLLDKALEGARVFIHGLKGLDQGMIVLFSDRLLTATPFSSEAAELSTALTGVTPAGGSAINDHLYLALKRLDAQPGRPVVVLLSDGLDVHSALPMKEVVWKASRSQALIYWIQLLGEGESGGDTFSTAWRSGDQQKVEMEQLKEAVEQSGGEILPIARPEELTSAFANILVELRSQYVLGYYPSNAAGDGSWHKVRVAVKGTQRVRHRGGYIDN